MCSVHAVKLTAESVRIVSYLNKISMDYGGLTYMDCVYFQGLPLPVNGAVSPRRLATPASCRPPDGADTLWPSHPDSIKLDDGSSRGVWKTLVTMITAGLDMAATQPPPLQHSL